MLQLDPCPAQTGRLLSLPGRFSSGGGKAGGAVESELVVEWIAHLKRRNFSPTTTRSYRETLTTFRWWLADQHVVLEDASARHVETWLGSRALKPSTRRLYLSRIRAFYGWMLDERHLVEDPSRTVVQVRVGRHLPRPAPAQSIYQNLSAADTRVAAMIALGAYTGMRRFEIAKLRAEDIDFTTLPPVVTVRGKGSVDRRIPLNPTVQAALERHGLPVSGWVFPSNRGGGPLSAQRCGRLIANALSSSSGRVTAHQLRHWFGSTLYQGSGDIRMVQELLGHQSIATTQIYCAWDPGRAGTAVGALPSPPEAA